MGLVKTDKLMRKNRPGKGQSLSFWIQGQAAIGESTKVFQRLIGGIEISIKVSTIVVHLVLSSQWDVKSFRQNGWSTKLLNCLIVSTLIHTQPYK